MALRLFDIVVETGKDNLAGMFAENARLLMHRVDFDKRDDMWMAAFHANMIASKYEERSYRILLETLANSK